LVIQALDSVYPESKNSSLDTKKQVTFFSLNILAFIIKDICIRVCNIFIN